MLSDEMMLDGYPSLLILGREGDEGSCHNQDQIIKSVLKKGSQGDEMAWNKEDKLTLLER